ncbi:MAG: NADH:flavin oxidoreductase [Pseudomonadales bacterium]
MTDPYAPLGFRSGHRLPNRFMLAPLTNCQSNDDGTLSDAEHHWLTLRAQGGFGLTMTCAAHVQPHGRAFPGQLGICSDSQLPGHRRLAADIKAAGSIAIAQLHHGGSRCPEALIGVQPVSASVTEAADADTKTRALNHSEVEALRDDFIAAAVRAKAAGYDGVEVHGAHGYIVCQFLSSATNQRQDAYGGSQENRERLLMEIVSGIAQQCGPEFTIGVRLSPERFGIELNEALHTSTRLIDTGLIDFLDISLWDSFKEPVEEAHQGRSLLSYFAGLERKDVALTVAGKIHTADQVRAVLAEGIDFVTLGRAGILHHDYPRQMQNAANFEPVSLPVSRSYLRDEGLSDIFIDYMDKWKGFVAP